MIHISKSKSKSSQRFRSVIQKVFVHVPSEIAAHDVQKLLFCCLILLLSSVLFLTVTARSPIFKAAKGKGAPIRVPKEALKPVDDGGNSKRRAILLGVGALALSSCPASSLFAEEIPQNYEAFVNKSDGYSYYYPSDWTSMSKSEADSCLPITIDVGTNNENLLNDEFYIGLRQRRAAGQEYAELLHEFMSAVKQIYGEKVLVQFEDFANHNAFDLLAKYGSTHLVFNDDIQGIASVVLVGLISALKVVGGSLADHKFLFLGAGEAGTGIAELIALEISKQTGVPLEESRKKVWLVDSKGLIVSSRMESLQHFKKPWAHEHEPVKELIDAIKAIKPTVLIGSSGAGSTFTKEVVETMTSLNEKPVILALSNPTSQSECTAEEAYTWSKGRAIFASGSPFGPVEYDGKVYLSGQANNAYIFPGLGLGLIISGAIRVHDDMLLVAWVLVCHDLLGMMQQEKVVLVKMRIGSSSCTNDCISHFGLSMQISLEKGENQNTHSVNGDDDSVAKMKAAEDALQEKEKQKPSFELSGKLASETNRVRGDQA
ncbi:unnamed protein product [Camellia sinensis]